MWLQQRTGISKCTFLFFNFFWGGSQHFHSWMCLSPYLSPYLSLRMEMRLHPLPNSLPPSFPIRPLLPPPARFLLQSPALSRLLVKNKKQNVLLLRSGILRVKLDGSSRMQDVYVHTCMQAYIYAYMHACMHAYMHTYTHTCIHTHTHPQVILRVELDGNSRMQDAVLFSPKP